MKNKKWFTLVELLMALLIAWTLIWIVMWIYTWIMWSDVRMLNKRLLTSEASDLMDMIHTAALDYTIDYEEYFNRRWLWYGPWNTWFTSYGNSWERYYCWSWNDVVASNTWYSIKSWEEGTWWCLSWWNQKYLEYQFQHHKLSTWALNHRDNSWSNMYFWPVAISPNTWLDYLYLISPDGSERYYFRRIFIRWNWWSGKNDNLYKIQVLRLKWYDAWSGHNFDETYSWWRYDWFIDTWACDFSQWFICSWTGVTWGDRMPNSSDDWRVDITSDNVTVNDFRIDIYPTKDPYLDMSTDNLLDPYIKITMTMNIYNKPSDDEITLSTTLSFKNSYFNYPIEVRECVPNDDWYDTYCSVVGND